MSSIAAIISMISVAKWCRILDVRIRHADIFIKDGFREKLNEVNGEMEDKKTPIRPAFIP
ncbi:hypothetical protein AYX07_10295 [Thermoactinomyces sp. AS95]|nr:hypothetical protein JS81_00495 [Thermoactinomyces sp. Gus2-1]KYQ86406.1 hypothetical protein AYX07_10295 [Thermoactinomyces sp. AS95]